MNIGNGGLFVTVLACQPSDQIKKIWLPKENPSYESKIKVKIQLLRENLDTISLVRTKLDTHRQ
jgi:hypothetical protein